MYAVGNPGLMQQFGAEITNGAQTIINGWLAAGKSVVYYGKADLLLAAIAITDRIKPTSEAAVKQLQQAGIEVHLLTGDGAQTAELVANPLHLGHFRADHLPSHT